MDNEKNDTPGNSLAENYSFDGDTYTYTDKVTNTVYTWDKEKSEWFDQNQQKHVNSFKELPKNRPKSKNSDEEEEKDSDEEEEKVQPNKQTQPNKQDMSKGVYGYEGDAYTYTDATDGTKYFWDREKNAWFPKIDDDFIAYYQMSYGFASSESKKDNDPPVSILPVSVQPVSIPPAQEKNASKKSIEPEPNLKRKVPEEPPKWFELDDEHNTKVYVTNLPLDVTETEFVDLMQKCGLVMKDIDTGKMKIKLYADPETKILKGDALCTYIKKESVDLALKFLDGSDFKGHQIKVEKAHFRMKGNAYDPNLKPKKRRRKDKDKIKKMQERLFAWVPDKLRGERAKHEQVVVLKNLFDPKIFDENLSLILEYRQDLQEECAKCGAVKKVVVYDKHPDGVAQIWFKDAEAADACVQLMNNRWFSQRKISAETWDGKTRYKIQETPEEREARLKKWEEFLNTNKGGNTQEKKNEDTSENPEEGKMDCTSDGTRSSAGSDDETDDEEKNETVE